VTEFEIVSRKFTVRELGKRRKTSSKIAGFETEFEPITPNFVIRFLTQRRSSVRLLVEEVIIISHLLKEFHRFADVNFHYLIY